MNLLLENFAGNGEKRDVTVECRNFILTSAWRHPSQMLTHHSGLPSAVPPLNLINIVISLFTISQLNSSLSSAISLSILSFSLTSMSFHHGRHPPPSSTSIISLMSEVIGFITTTIPNLLHLKSPMHSAIFFIHVRIYPCNIPLHALLTS